MISRTDSLDYKTKIKKQLVLFLILPLASLINAFKYNNLKIITNTIWAFVAFHGFTLVVTDEGMDSARYAEKLEALHNQPITWNNFILSLFSSQNVDIIEPLLSYGVSLFTDNSRILFLVYGVVFGYFYSRNIGYLIKSVNFKNSRLLFFLIATFALIIPFWEINGFRMWTAAHIFFFAAVRMIDGKLNLKNIILLLLAPLMHFSFVLPIGVLLFYKIIGNRPLPYFILFWSTFLVSEIDLGVVRNFVLDYAPEFLDRRVKGYTREGQMEELREAKESVVFYIKYQGVVFKIAIVILLSYIFIKNKTLKKLSVKGYNYLSFALLFLAVGNLMSLIPSGGRFLSIANLFALTAIIFFWQSTLNEKVPQWIKKPSLFLFFLFGFISIWRGFQTMSVMMLIGNPIFAMFSNLETSLSQVVKLEFL